MPTVDCSLCGEPFYYGEAGAGGWGSREREDIDCPHCGGVHGQQVTAGHFVSTKLTPEQLAAHRAENPKPAAVADASDATDGDRADTSADSEDGK